MNGRLAFFSHIRPSFLLLLLCFGCKQSPPPAEQFPFLDISSQLAHRHVNGKTGQRYILEIMGAGAALFDYDNDGDLDLFLVQGGPIDGKTERTGGRLFRNDLADGQLAFIDVTQASGIQATGYGMGVAVADYDRDGFSDLYLTNYGDNQLWRNLGNGSFEDVTLKAKANDSGWSAPATFFDYDGDGYLDLYVGNYLKNPLDNPPRCKNLRGAADYCGPGSFQPLQDRLLRNRGDGSFENVTERLGLNTIASPALGVLTLDLNGDGLTDIYVANDAQANNLWVNEGEGRFRDEALLAGLAVNSHGKPEASMGLDAGDYDGDGDWDIIITHLSEETNTLYRNQGGFFEDATDASGLGAPSRPFTGFGGAWLDFDNDGWLDFFVANGAIKRSLENPDSLGQPNQLFHNDGSGIYQEVVISKEPSQNLVSRGVAFGDLDNDGDTDLVVCNNDGPVQLWLNQVGHQAHWLGLRLHDEQGRNVSNAQVVIHLAGGRQLLRRATREGSYCSANDPRILAGLGPNETVAKLVVKWSGGDSESFPGPTIDNYHTLTKGKGRIE